MDAMMESILRTVISFILLILITLVIGKHINAHKNHYNFALSITIGSYIANMGFNTKLGFLDMMAGFVSMIVLFYLLLIAASKSRKIRGWLTGKPTVVIENGKILETNMKKVKFSIDDLNQQLREGGVFHIQEVEYALLEDSGKLSVLKKKPFQSITKQDLNLSSGTEALPVELIMDGKIIEKNVSGKYDQEWIQTELRKRSLQLEDVYYAVVNSGGKLFVDTHNDALSSPADVE
ncbi:hypothetical protein WQ57_13635 [Mesobacillus campisalis]|uniref:YetF C-terminal domain-containing protein n=2 Tax=Mesobacillus campisalis TaxID=1408103 RepID=A0A0M2SWZ1_9BACI|nr:hypothetical protein WQ57_13635 [Mesobacillus campisalis]